MLENTSDYCSKRTPFAIASGGKIANDKSPLKKPTSTFSWLKLYRKALGEKTCQSCHNFMCRSWGTLFVSLSI